MNRSELIEYLKVQSKMQPPYLQSDFWLKFGTSLDTIPIDNTAASAVIVQDFTLPDLGISVKESAQLFGLPEFFPQYGRLSYDFIAKADDDLQNLVPLQWYNNQFTQDGLLRFKQGSDVQNDNQNPVDTETINLFLGNTSIFTAERCKFTRPVPTMSQKSNAFVVYKQTVSFLNFKYNI